MRAESAGETALAVEGLGKSFPPSQVPGQPIEALRGVELNIRSGEFVSVIGPSGCGKTTLLELLAGLEQPSAGSITRGSDPSTRLLGEVGYMPQEDSLMPWRSVLDNAALPLELEGVARAEARSRALEMFPAFGLTGFEGAWPFEISGGMRQRASLLRTFLTGHELLLLDEPFGALDALTRQRMQVWLLGVWERDRKTVVFVTHDLEEALFLSDRVLVMSPRPGRVEMELEVGLPRPRSPETTTLDPAFIELKSVLLARLRSEMSGQL